MIYNGVLWIRLIFAKMLKNKENEEKFNKFVNKK